MNNIALHELAKKIAPLIGYEYPTEQGWPGNYDNDGKLRDGWAYLVHKENGELKGALSIDPIEHGSSKGRIEIRVSWPNSGREHGYQNYIVTAYRHNNRKSSITVSGEKSPEQIAKDIKSRFLPDGESLFQEAWADMLRDLEHKAKKKSAIIEVAEYMNSRVSPHEFSGSPYFYSKGDTGIKVQVHSGDSFKLEIDLSSVEQVKALVEFAKELKQKHVESVIRDALKG